MRREQEAAPCPVSDPTLGPLSGMQLYPRLGSIACCRVEGSRRGGHLWSVIGGWGNRGGLGESSGVGGVIGGWGSHQGLGET